MATVRIDALPATVAPSVAHIVAAMKDGIAYRLTIQQIVDLAVSAVTDGAPEALDTLNEIAAALGDDADAVSAILARLTVNETDIGANATAVASLAVLVDSNHILAQSDIAAAAATMSPPVGSVALISGASAPARYLKANGAAVSRSTYAALWAHAQASGCYHSSGGTKPRPAYGPGDGSTTFTLPDYRGVAFRAFDDGAGVDTGRSITAEQLDALQGHGHAVGTRTVIRGDTSPTLATLGAPSWGSYTGEYAEPISEPVSTGSYGTPRLAAETRMRNVALLACIRAY